MARKFLYVFAVLIALVIAGAIAYRLAGNRILRMALVPTETFQAQASVDPRVYADAKMWIARPDIPGNPARWTPAGYTPAPAGQAKAAVFFIHPTSYIGRAHWNAALDDAETNARAAIFLRGQASAFNDLVRARTVTTTLGHTYDYGDTGRVHALMGEGKLPEGNVAVLVSAAERGLGKRA